MGLRTISGLRHGWIKARESKPVTLVSEDQVQVTLPCVAPQAAAMIRLQLLTRMRPGEVLCMTPRDLDRSGDIWIYKPKKHKNRWRGHRRHIQLGARASLFHSQWCNLMGGGQHQADLLTLIGFSSQSYERELF